jgi:hypothetical protein
MEYFVEKNLNKIPCKCLYKSGSEKTVIFLPGTAGNYEEWDDIYPLENYKQISKSWSEIKKYKNERIIQISSEFLSQYRKYLTKD